MRRSAHKTPKNEPVFQRFCCDSEKRKLVFLLFFLVWVFFCFFFTADFLPLSVLVGQSLNFDDFQMHISIEDDLVFLNESFLGFTEFYWVLGVLIGLGHVLLGKKLVLRGFTGFDWLRLGFTRFYWILLGFTGFHWVLYYSLFFQWSLWNSFINL